MKYWTSGVIVLYLCAIVLVDGKLDYLTLVLALSLAAAGIFKERFWNTAIMSVFMLVLTGVATAIDSHFAVLFALVCYDLVSKQYRIGAAVVALAVLWYGLAQSVPVLTLTATLVILVLSGLLAYAAEQGERRKQEYQFTLDNERRLRYELESAKARLLQASAEIASITEVQERNRIARELHDSIGHSLTGILIQLQAAHKLQSRDAEKAEQLLSRSITGLAESVGQLRDTVHNIKPQEQLGVAYLQGIAEHYGFCPVELKLSGDFNTVPASHMDILIATMKEALTNAARYSRATKVEIAIDSNDRYTRLYVKDNGKGADSFKEGMGLSGIRERVSNVGGSVSISGKDGFLIVCLLPRQGGGGLVEGTHRR